MSSSAEKLQNLAITLSTIQENIETKKKKMLGKIDKLQEDLDNLKDRYSDRSEWWINKKREELQNKINKYKEDLEVWVYEQTEKAETWCDGVKENIQKSIEKTIYSKINALL